MSYVTSHGTEIYYEVHGDGPETLVFAHGMGGNGAIWFNQLAYFHERYRIVVFDHRCFGRSRATADEFRPALFMEDALAILDAVRVDSATFVCQSLGGWTGSPLAISHPERVNALVMSHTPGVFTHKDAINDRTPVADLIDRPASAFSTSALALDYPDKNPAGAALYQQIGRFNSLDLSIVPRRIGEAGIGRDIDSLTDYRVPTLFITGDKDELFSPAYIRALATALGADFLNLGDVGHSSYFETPNAFNVAVDTFLGSI